MSDRYRGTVRAPEFPSGMEWLNTETPLSILGLRGKVVVLDFWTYCCINCLHVLPELRKLEERFPEEVVVIGIHSAKFDAEKETFNLRQAVMRYDIRHPVVNDDQFVLWRGYAVRAWPTLMIVDPEGRIVGRLEGEFDGETVAGFIRQIVERFDEEGKIDRTPLPLALERHKLPETLLAFPGRVLADVASQRIFVADTGNHRILAFGLRDGKLRQVYGTGQPGLRNGPANGAQFRSPQGMALRGNSLYVADTGNHVIRRIALDGGGVSAVAGQGGQASPFPRSGPGMDTRLNSPWDVLAIGDVLYVAMAGSHQIWALNLRSGRMELFAGEGREALRDGSRLEARLAQPSGLSTDGFRLWFADSETSSVRAIDLGAEEEVRTYIGSGLFDFGDVDGTRRTARLQHVLDIECAEDGLVYVADTYNHKIKVLDPHTGDLRTLAGNGEPGFQDGEAREVSFWEPGGLSLAGDLLYVADTNNHAVRAVDRNTGETWTVDLRE